jgi:uncharacterized protein (TIGR03435 family)
MRLNSVFLSIVLCTVTVVAQPARFDVVSVRAQPSPVTLGSMLQTGLPRILPGGAFRATHVTVEGLLTFAYDMKAFQIVGGPDWIRTRFYHVEARAAKNAAADQVKLMIQSLVEERFNLVHQRERRSMKFQALVLARSDGRLGPNTLSVEDCGSEKMRDTRKLVSWAAAPGESGAMIGCSIGFADLASGFSMRFKRPVVDATGLSRRIFFTLRVGSALAQFAENSDLPSVSTALNEQLGLRLESREGPISVLVIDSIEPASEN